MPGRRRSRGARGVRQACGWAFALCVFAPALHAQQSASAPGSAARPARAPAADQGPNWASLSPAQRQALKPLERDWATIDAPRKSKWLEIAERYPAMSPQEQERIQARMTEWARMTPQQRSDTRRRFQDVKKLPPEERQAGWEAYQSLSDEQRAELAGRARPAASAPASSPRAARAAQGDGVRAEAANRQTPQGKVNAVPAAGSVPPPKPVAPSVVQAKPGATTTLISKTPSPPAHQPSGSPKIAATPAYVDKKTLLPQTGAQSTAPARAPSEADKRTDKR